MISGKIEVNWNKFTHLVLEVKIGTTPQGNSKLIAKINFSFHYLISVYNCQSKINQAEWSSSYAATFSVSKGTD